MDRHKSALKAHRQSEKRYDANRRVRAACRTEVKKLREALEGSAKNSAETLVPMLNRVQKVLMTAGRKKIIEPLAASRTISRLSKAVHKATTAK